MPSLTPHIAELTSRHGSGLVHYLRRVLDDGGEVSLSPWMVASTAEATGNNAISEHDAAAFLDSVVTLGILQKNEYLVCNTNTHVKRLLSTEEIEAEQCFECERIFVDMYDHGPIRELRYETTIPISEDIRWMVVLHGMNTTGDWQQELTWLISQQWGYTIPVYIYKYGKVRLGVTMRRLQHRIKRRLYDKLVSLISRMEKRRFGGKPDVLAHSFGTWLIANALKDNPSLKIRRLILVGSVVPPDFDWDKLIERGQVDAILCHFSPVDGWVGKAHYTIPDSGPSGRIGFNAPSSVFHRREEHFGHSQYFSEKNLETMTSEIWGRFFTLALGRLGEVQNVKEINPDWKKKWWPFRAGRIPWL